MSKEECKLRLTKARELMSTNGFDALVVTSSAIGRWFTSSLEPHEWHDQCQARFSCFILTPTIDMLLMSPATDGEHLNTTRRSTWVSSIRGVFERVRYPREELWDVGQLPVLFAELGLSRARLGFELGDCMTLGMSFNDFLELRELMPRASLDDASALYRRLTTIHTVEEQRRVRLACQAGHWIHEQSPRLLQSGLSERQLFAKLSATFSARFDEDYHYRPEGAWDVRNQSRTDSDFFHAHVTDRPYRDGDLVCRSTSGASYRRYPGDLDRVWYLGVPPQRVLDWYDITWECNQSMVEQVAPGHRCSEVYAACAAVESRHGLPPRPAGSVGHGFRNTGSLSIHPDNHTILEPGMIVSVEPMFATEYGWFDLEDQYLVTENGREALHQTAPEHLPSILIE